MPQLRKYLKQRGLLLVFSAVIGGISALLSSPPRDHDLPGLKAALGAEGRLLVENVAWEPSQGILGDLLGGRAILFEAARASDPLKRGDIYRTFVRVSPEGRVLDVGEPRNLTNTKNGHERQLVVQGKLAAFTTRSDGAPANLTFLGLDRKYRTPQRSSFGPLGKLQLGLTRLLETGSWSGLIRSDVFLKDASLTFDVTLTADQVTLQWGEQSAQVKPSDLFQAEAPLAQAEGIEWFARAREPLPWLHWAANTGRHLVGTGPVAWAEGRVFSLWDSLQRASYNVVSTTPPRPASPLPVQTTHTEHAGKHGIWPPAPIAIPGANPEDGKWRPVRNDVLPQQEEPLFYRTVIHPDPERPYAELHLVAMDMRRLELGIGAGYEDPHPETGPPGSGQIPDDPAIYERVVATFNGAFKAAHGNYGMKAEGRLLVEPVVNAATVVIDSATSAGFGTWSEEDDPRQVKALRQNLDPLVANGKVNPAGRKIWGDQLYGAGVAVERSALCLHESGQLFYGWALEATGESLAAGLATAGCSYAIHLDMNPGHCAFLFNDVKSIAPLKARGQTLDPRMKVNATRFVRWSPKDFFYLMQRAGVPHTQGIEWEIAPGEGPPPRTIPAIFLGKKKMGGLLIEIDRVAAGRLAFQVVPGTAENPKIEPSPSPPPPRIEGALIAWGLGHRTRANRPGLAIDQQIVAPLDRAYASFVLQDGKPKLIPPSEPQTERAGLQIVQFPVLARGGKLVEYAQELGGHRARAALCIDPGGNLLVARMTHDTAAPLAQSLVDLGCELVVELDRGSHPPPLVERAGTDSPPHQGYEQSVLYGVATPMDPHTHSF